MASGATNGDDLELRAPRRRQPSVMLGRPSYSIQKTVAELQDHYQSVQKRTFTRWMNSHLCKWRPPLEVKDLFEDIKDGTKLVALLQILSGERLTIETSRKSRRVHYLSNMQTALKFLETRKIKLVNINPADVVDGKPSIVLGLLWTIILYFQIEELTNTLAFSDLSASTSSLDSFAEEGSPAKKKKQGGKPKWKGQAKKALLHWVKKKTSSNPSGFNIVVKDFGPSWRDGKAFNTMIHTIRPELVDLEEVDRSTNKENLEHAFGTAEQHLGIPRLLEPEDVDVEKPDEKSIMTYVAQFVNKYATTGDSEKAPQVDENTIQYEDVMSWLYEAETKLADVHKRFRYRGQDYQERAEFQTGYDNVYSQAQMLREKWASGAASSISDEQIGQMDKLMEKIDNSAKKWHRELDSRLPGQLGEVGAWLHEAEDVLSRKYDDVADEEEMGDVIKRQMDEHRAVFKNKKIMEQMFQRSRNTRTSRMSGQAVPREQLEDISQRLSRITTESTSRMAQLEFMEAKCRMLGFLATSETMLKTWTVKYGRKPSVDILLQNYKETIEKGNFIDKFKVCSEKLMQTGEAYLASDISPEEKDLVMKFLADKEAQVADMCVELQSVESMLEEVGKNWEQYETCVAKIQPWLDKAEELIRTKGKKGKEFFRDLPEWVQLHATMNNSANFLIETCDEAVSKDIKQQILLLNGRWKQVFEVCKGYMREEELAKMREEFRIGVCGLQEWLESVETTITQPLPIEYQPVKEHLQDMEDIRDEIHRAEEKYKAVSKLAQGLVKDTPQEQVNQMLVSMTEIKDRLLKVRGDVNTYIGNCSEMLQPLQEIEEDSKSLEEWLDSAQQLLDDYQKPDKDVETLYQKHQQCFARNEEQQGKLARLGKALEKVKKMKLPGMDVAQMEDKVTESSARLQICAKEAAEWKPKLKAGTEASREYKKQLGAMQHWIQDAEKLLNKPLDQEAPTKLMQEHQEFFAEVDSALLPALLQASKNLQASQITESEKSKVHEMVKDIQHEYAAALKRSSQRLMKLKFLEAEDKFNALVASCHTHIDEEDGKLQARERTNEELLDQHKNYFDEPFVEMDDLLNTMETLGEQLKQSAPDDYTWNQKVTELREEYEDVVAAEEEMYTKLTELPEKWKEFNAKLDQVQKYVEEAAQVMETVHKPIAADKSKFDVEAEKLQKVSTSKEEHLSALEWLSAALIDIAKHARPEDVEKHQETLLALTASSKSVLNALGATKRRAEVVQHCFQYKEKIQQTLGALEREIKDVEKFSEDAKAKHVDNLEEASAMLDAYQSKMSALDSMSVQVRGDISLGKELHSDEQAPAFLYSEVQGLEKKWEQLQEVAEQKQKEFMNTVQAWQEHEALINELEDFMAKTLPSLETGLRLSNVNSINQELVAKMALRDQVEQAIKGLEIVESNVAALSKNASYKGKQALKKEHEDLKKKLDETKTAVEQGISQVEGIKQQWQNCEQEMAEVLKWAQDMHLQISKVEQSLDTQEEQFAKAQDTVGTILAKSQELAQLEERLGTIEGLESPTTLHAKLATVRGKLEQVHSRAQGLVTSLGENLSHQEKFESTSKQVEEYLTAAEQHLQEAIEPCESSDDVQDRKDDHMKFCHSLEQIRLGFTMLQSEAKLLKDPTTANSTRKVLQDRYSSLMNSVRTRTQRLDEAINKWHQYEKKLAGVRQYIERCEELVSADQGALPGDPHKLQQELILADKLCDEVQLHKDTLEEHRESIDEIDQIIPVDTDSVLTQINAMAVLLGDLPQQFADRKRIISSALASHIQYNETVNTFTTWLMKFEKSLRSTTEVYLDDVPDALNVIKVCMVQW